MVKDVENLDAQLCGISLSHMPHLFQGEIHVLETRPMEEVAGCVTQRSVRGRRQNASVLDVAGAGGASKGRKSEVLMQCVAVRSRSCCGAALPDRRRCVLPQRAARCTPVTGDGCVAHVAESRPGTGIVPA